MDSKELTKLNILKRLSPGTGLREGLDDILRGKHGALIVIGNPAVANLFEGGFRVNCKFNSKRLAELAKMDGAIILSEDFKKILYANTFLVPDRTLSTIETGTRHQAAERTAKQINGLVIAVSERREKITVYYKNSKFSVQPSTELLRRATETLQILEKQREVFDELISNLNVLEVTNLVSVSDVCSMLQRMEIIKKMADIINEYIVALGREGIIVRMRMKELVKGINKEKEFIIKDYGIRNNKLKQFFELNFENLLGADNVASILFGDSSETSISPKGYRILNKTSLNETEIDNLMNNFKNFEEILDKDDGKIKQVLGEKTDVFQKEIAKLREQIMIGKKI